MWNPSPTEDRTPLMPYHSELGTPFGYAHDDDAGIDLTSIEDLVLAPGERALVRTGISVNLPPRTVGLVCPRSGLANTYGIGIVNSPGVVDQGYNGEIRANLINHSTEPFTIKAGDRIAQLLVMPVITVTPVVASTEEITGRDTARGTSGHGSTGR